MVKAVPGARGPKSAPWYGLVVVGCDSSLQPRQQGQQPFLPLPSLLITRPEGKSCSFSTALCSLAQDVRIGKYLNIKLEEIMPS